MKSLGVPGRLGIFALLVALSACGGGGSSGGGGSILPQSTATPSPTTVPTLPPDDWTTYAHDQQLTGFERQATAYTKTSAPKLQLLWTQQIDAACGVNHTVAVVDASPLVANGLVYVASLCGNVYALRRDTGAVAWTVNINGAIHGTPVLADGRLIIPVYGTDSFKCMQNGSTGWPCGVAGGYAQGGTLVALDPSSGTTLWHSTPLAYGIMRGEPIVLNGTIYEGVAGGDDFSGCINGGIATYNESTGNATGSMWQTTSTANGGGGVWSPISTDGQQLFFGTGNTCSDDGAKNSLVALSTSLSLNWNVPAVDPIGLDEDVGGGTLVWNGVLYFEGKDGILYAVDATTHATRWTAQLQPFQPGDGGIGTPSTDGNAVIVTSGYTTCVTGGCNGGYLEAFDPGSGTPKYQLGPTIGTNKGYVAFVNGVGFAAQDQHVVAFDSSAGTILWTSPTTADYFYGSPVVVPSGIYAADTSGNVYAYTLPVTPSSTMTRHASSYIRPLQHFTHAGSRYPGN